MILDLHSHKKAPYPQGIISLGKDDVPIPGQLYSAGIHPWDVPALHDELDLMKERVERIARSEQVVAIGEAGLDNRRGGPYWLQMEAFKWCAELAEELGKPLIIHDVKSHDAVIAVWRDVRAQVPWIIHGFRAKPSVAHMLMTAGIQLSFGPFFNTDSLRLTPPEALYAETDDSPLSIEQVIAIMAEARGCRPEEMMSLIAANTARLLAGR